MAEDASRVRAAIDEDRAELAETVQALAQKADVRGRVHDAVAEKSDELQHKAAELGERVRDMTPDDARAAAQTAKEKAQQQPALVMIVVAVLLALLVVRRRRSKR